VHCEFPAVEQVSIEVQPAMSLQGAHLPFAVTW
jgi:hypothetical protein